MRSGVGVTGEFAHLRQSSTPAPGRVRALIDRVPLFASLYGLACGGASVFKLSAHTKPRNSGRKERGRIRAPCFGNLPPREATKPGGFIASVPRDPRPLSSRGATVSVRIAIGGRMPPPHRPPPPTSSAFFGLKPKNGARAARSSADGDGSRHWTRAKDRARHGAAHP